MSYQNYCKDYKKLSKEEQNKIFKQIEECKENISSNKDVNQNTTTLIRLKQDIANAYMPMIIKAATNSLGLSNNLQDLIHEGVIGLYHAIDKFDYKKNYSFCTYALPWIKIKMAEANKNVFSIYISQYFMRKFKEYQEEMCK